MNNNSAKRASIALGVFMAIVLIAGAIIPLFTRNQTTTTETSQATDVPIPTFPPPPSDLNVISFDHVFLHPTGIFTIGQPDGWQASEPNKGASIAQVNLVNSTSMAVVDSYVEDAGAEAVVQPEALSDRFTRDVINSSWARFNTWSETARAFDPATGKLQIDFNVTLNRQQYVARQQVWTDGRWIYVIRVLTPENATEMLRYLLDGFSASFTPNTFFEGTPLNWTAYYDSAENHIIRYPSEWSLTDSAPGRPTSIASNNGVLLRVDAAAGTNIADEAAARAYVEAMRAEYNTTAVTVKAIERNGDTGFAVSYSFTSVDGDVVSGLVDLLNGLDGTLHIADLRFPAANIDLNALSVDVASASAAEATAEATAPVLAVDDASMIDVYRDLATVMSTFTIVSPIPLVVPPVTPTPVVPPTIAPTVEAPTVEATTEATAEVTEPVVETTPEATVEATAEMTPEVTAEAGS